MNQVFKKFNNLENNKSGKHLPLNKIWFEFERDYCPVVDRCVINIDITRNTFNIRLQDNSKISNIIRLQDNGKISNIIRLQDNGKISNNIRLQDNGKISNIIRLQDNGKISNTVKPI